MISPKNSSFKISVGIRNATDFSPFGVELKGRNFEVVGGGNYRFGFNGMEADNDVKGEGNSYDFGARMFDVRLGRFYVIDALSPSKSNLSPYQSLKNNPIIFRDPDGNDEFLSIVVFDKRTNTTTTIRKNTAISTKVMAGKTYWTEKAVLKQQVYHDFRTVINVTIDEKGNAKATKSWTYEGRLPQGKSITKGVIIGDTEGEIVDFSESTWEGSGDTQKGGYTYTSKTGGASPTKYKSLSDAPTVDLENFLIIANAVGNFVKIGNEIPDMIVDMTRIVQDAIEVKEKYSKKSDSNNGVQKSNTSPGVDTLFLDDGSIETVPSKGNITDPKKSNKNAKEYYKKN